MGKITPQREQYEKGLPPKPPYPFPKMNEYIAMCPKCEELRVGLDSEIIIDLSPQNSMHCGNCKTPIRKYVVYQRIGTLEETNAVPRVR